MEYTRSLLILLAIGFAYLSQGQTNSSHYDFKFVPMANIPDPHGLGESDIVTNHAASSSFTFELKGERKKRFGPYETFSLEAYSRETGMSTAKIDIAKPWGENLKFDQLLVVQDRFYVIYASFDKESGKIDIYSEEFVPPALETRGEPKLLGSLSVLKRSIESINWLDATFYHSPDQEHTILYYDRLITENDEKIISIIKMNAEMEPEWQQSFILPKDEWRYQEKIVVTDQGVVYGLMGRLQYNANPLETSQTKYAYELFRFDPASLVRQAVSVPDGAFAIRPDMVLAGDQLRVGGLTVESGTGCDATGYFISEHDLDLTGSSIVMNKRFAEKIGHRPLVSRLIPKPSGGNYLIGTVGHYKNDFQDEKLFVVVSLDESWGEEWITKIPRDVTTNRTHENSLRYAFACLVRDNGISLLAPEVHKNVERYQAGQEPKSALNTANMFLDVAIDNDGKVSYSKFLQGEQFYVPYGSGSTIGEVQLTDGTYIATARTYNSETKKTAAGILYLQPKR